LVGRQRLFLIIFIASIITLLLVFFTKGILATVLIAVIIFILLIITKNIWLPDTYGKAMVRRYSLYIIFTITTFFTLGNHILQLFQEKLLNTIIREFPVLNENLNFVGQNSIVVFIFVLVGIFIVNYFMRDTTTIGQHVNPIEVEFPEKEYKQRLKLFCNVLYDDLNKTDRETNWSSDQFIPLDAEVEIKTNNKKKRRISDLLTAIKSNKRSKVFLIIGDPGAGKSVSLRKLAKDLLKEVNKSGKIPIYVNLKEWEFQGEWSEENPPNSKQLYDFVINNLKDRLDVFANEFIDLYFKKMFDSGRLFIILDSFDEIPSVLDVDESSWLINQLSSSIYQFLSGAHESRGILSSRIFRKPTQNFQAQCVLEVRQLSELKVKEVFKRSLFYNEKISDSLFKERQELVPIAKNPFIAALILNYAKENENTLPMNQSELYANYLNSRLRSACNRIQKKGLTSEKILSVATEIAYKMFSSSSGLEISVEQLNEHYKDLPIDDILEVLTYCRIGRIGTTTEKRFSFVHRRFNEYFVAKKMLENNDIPIESIPTDSRFRDALVLYCEVAPEVTAKRIADYCWLEIKRVSSQNITFTDPQYLRAIHCIRFLKDAFRSRTQCVSEFQDGLAEYILNLIKESENIIAIKQSIEVVGLLKVNDVDNIILKAFQIENEWLNETALKSCRYLPSLTVDLEHKILTFLFRMNPFKFFKRRKEILFSLSFSDGFSQIKRYCSLRIIDIYLLIFSLILQTVIHPLILFFIFVFYLASISINYLTYEMLGTLHKITKVEKKRVDNLRRVRIKIMSMLSNLFTLRLLCSSMMLFAFFLSILKDKESVLSNTISVYFLELFSVDYLIPYIIGLVVVTMMPWVELVFYVRKLKLKDIKLKFLLVILIILLIQSLVAYLFSKVIPKVVLEVMLSTTGIILILFSIIRTCIYYISYRFDKKIIKNSSSVDIISREEISDILLKMKTNSGKAAYIRILEEKKIKFNGEWKNVEILMSTNNGPYTQLAKIEEKMLGLE